jgi:hypothetical protein
MYGHYNAIAGHFGREQMLDRNWLIAAFLISALLTVGGCSGNFKYNDDEYRPLGEPATLNREQ